MPVSYKTLGQSAPNAATATTLYTCPSATETVVSSVTICNRSSTPTSFRLSVDVGGGGDANPDYIAYDCPILGNETIVLTLGICLQATDLLRVYATLATLSFNAFGQENT